MALLKVIQSISCIPNHYLWSILSGFLGENMSVYPCHPCIPLFFMVVFVSLKEQFAWDSVWGRDTSDIHTPAQGWIHMLEHKWLVSSGLSKSETSAWPGGVLAQQLRVHQDYLGMSVPELFEQLTQGWVPRLPRKTSATASEVCLEWLPSFSDTWMVPNSGVCCQNSWPHVAALSSPAAGIKISFLYLHSESHPLCIPFCFCKSNLEGGILKFPRMSKLPNFSIFRRVETCFQKRQRLWISCSC